MVDGLERKIRDRAVVARVDVGGDSGGEIAARYGIRGVPAFLLLDPNGNVLYRKVGGTPDTDRIEQLVNDASAPAAEGSAR